MVRRALLAFAVALSACDSAPAPEDAAIPPGVDGAIPAPDARRDDAGPIAPPPSACEAPATLVDTSSGSTVVGDGTPASCTEAALRSALDGAVRESRVITFDCGSSPHTIPLSSELLLNAWDEGFDGTVVIDGGGRVTLDGQRMTRILHIRSSFERDQPRVTVQRLGFANALTTDVPNTSSTEHGGAAIYRLGGTLTILDSTFENGTGPESGQDVAGGAVYSIGVGTTTIVGSTFRGNRCSSGGAIGNLHAGLVLVNSVVEDNEATGSGGNPGNGGNGGGIYMDGVGNVLRLCGVTLRGNRGYAYGGGLFRVSNAEMPETTIQLSTIQGNRLLTDEQGLGGGLYLQGNVIRLESSTLADNEARGAGGLFFGPRSSLTAVNVTFSGNVARLGLGGAIFLGEPMPGSFVNCTFARNRATGEAAFGAAISGDASMLTARNTVFAYHEVGNGWNPISCTRPLRSEGGVFQYPVTRAGGGSDDPEALCAPDAMVADPMLGELGDHGGPTPTILPAAGSPLLGAGTMCPPTDQRGLPRTRCDVGAVSAD